MVAGEPLSSHRRRGGAAELRDWAPCPTHRRPARRVRPIRARGRRGPGRARRRHGHRARRRALPPGPAQPGGRRPPRRRLDLVADPPAHGQGRRLAPGHPSSDEDYVLDVDAGFGDALVARLSRFLLRTKAEIGAPEPATDARPHRRRPSRPRWTSRRRRRGCGDRRRGPAVGPGVTGPTTNWTAADADLTPVPPVPSVAPETYERYRIAHGIPAMGAELTEDTIPAEAGQWLIDASVSFTKGCYTGQELVARIDSRGGNVPRPVRLLVVEGDAPVVPGADVRVDGQSVGTVTSSTPPLSAGHPGLALAPARPVRRPRHDRRGRPRRGLDRRRRRRAPVRGPWPRLIRPTTTSSASTAPRRRRRSARRTSSWHASTTPTSTRQRPTPSASPTSGRCSGSTRRGRS